MISQYCHPCLHMYVIIKELLMNPRLWTFPSILCDDMKPSALLYQYQNPVYHCTQFLISFWGNYQSSYVQNSEIDALSLGLYFVLYYHSKPVIILCVDFESFPFTFNHLSYNSIAVLACSENLLTMLSELGHVFTFRLWHKLQSTSLL